MAFLRYCRYGRWKPLHRICQNWLLSCLWSWPTSWDVGVIVFWGHISRLVTSLCYCHHLWSNPWHWIYQNWLLICLSRWPMTWDIDSYVFWRPYWPPSWIMTFLRYFFTAGDQNLDIEYIKIDSSFVFVAEYELRHRSFSVLATILAAILEFKLFRSMQVLVLGSMVD